MKGEKRKKEGRRKKEERRRNKERKKKRTTKKKRFSDFWREKSLFSFGIHKYFLIEILILFI